MMDQYFGVKELTEVVLRAKAPMQFGDRVLEADEPVLYFENISIANVSEGNRPVMARGGWANMPRVIWDSRSEVTFTLSEGVMSNVSMSILLSANVTSNDKDDPIYVNKREGPYPLVTPTHYLDKGGNKVNGFFIEKEPIWYPKKKTFIFEYTRDVAQKKVYGIYLKGENGLSLEDNPLGEPFVAVYEDKNCTVPADNTKQYLIDYYYEYGDEALIYKIQKERFNGLFSLEGKFYSKDENDGINYTNLIYMPKVRVVSDIDLRLGERANPTVSVFNIIGLPDGTGYGKDGLIMEIKRLNSDLDEEI